MDLQSHCKSCGILPLTYPTKTRTSLTGTLPGADAFCPEWWDERPVPTPPSTPAQERGVWDCNLTQGENSVYSLRAGRCASECFGQRLRFQGSDGKVLTVVMLAVLIESQSEWPSQCAQRGMCATAEQTHLLTCTHCHLLSVYLLGTSAIRLFSGTEQVITRAETSIEIVM